MTGTAYNHFEYHLKHYDYLLHASLSIFTVHATVLVTETACELQLSIVAR